MNTSDLTPPEAAILGAAAIDPRNDDFATWPKFVYLIHFREKLHHAQHYLGASYELYERLHRHAHGRGAAITRALWTTAAHWELAALFVPKRATRQSIFDLERIAKRRHSSADYCPICRRLAQLKGKEGRKPDNIAPPGMMQYPLPFPINSTTLRNL